jgi:hypothetical protein
MPESFRPAAAAGAIRGQVLMAVFRVATASLGRALQELVVEATERQRVPD